MKKLSKQFYLLICILFVLFLLDGLDGCNNTGSSNNNNLHHSQHVIQKLNQQPLVDNHIKSTSSTNDSSQNYGLVNLGQQLSFPNSAPVSSMAFVKLETKDVVYAATHDANDYHLIIKMYSVSSQDGQILPMPTITKVNINHSQCTNCSIKALIKSPTLNVLYALVTPSNEQTTDANAQNTQIIEFTINPVDGKLSNQVDLSVFENIKYHPTGIAISPSGKHLYIATTGTDNNDHSYHTIIAKYQIDNQGHLTSEKTLLKEDGVAIGPLAISPDGTHGALILNVVPQKNTTTITYRNTIQGFSINGTTGNLTITHNTKVNDLNQGFLIPEHIFIGPDSKLLFAAFKDSNILAVYNSNNISLLTSIQIPNEGENKFTPTTITPYINKYGASYIVATNGHGLWKKNITDFQTSPQLTPWSHKVVTLSNYNHNNFQLTTQSFSKQNALYLNLGQILMEYAIDSKFVIQGLKDSNNNNVNSCNIAENEIRYNYSDNTLTVQCSNLTQSAKTNWNVTSTDTTCGYLPTVPYQTCISLPAYIPVSGSFDTSTWETVVTPTVPIRIPMPDAQLGTHLQCSFNQETEEVYDASADEWQFGEEFANADPDNMGPVNNCNGHKCTLIPFSKRFHYSITCNQVSS